MMKTMSTSPIWLYGRRCIADMLADCRGIAATEFAVIVPIMLVLFFGVVEFSSGVAIDRKVTLIARTLSDLTSQSPPLTQQATSATIFDSDLQNIFTASVATMYPYPPALVKATLSEIYVDSNSKATIQWSKAATISTVAGVMQATLTTSSHAQNDVVTTIVPSALLIKKTYLIYSEVSYLYTPTIGYVMKAAVNLADVGYARPRQVVCVVYGTPNPTQPAPVSGVPCPLL
jgi:Flp pilus assembly protein TadG